MPRYSRCKMFIPVNLQAQLIISLNTKNAFKNFLVNANHVKKVYETYK